MRIANVENNALNWVPITSAGALDMTHCDFSVTSARYEMRHIIGSSEPDVIIGSDKDQNRGCKKKDKDHMEFLCEMYEAQAARGRCELTSEIELDNEVSGEDHGHAGDENDSGGSVWCSGWPRATKEDQERANDHQRETSWSAAVK